MKRGKRSEHRKAGVTVALLSGCVAAGLLCALAPSSALGACSNEALRIGPSSQLPDCRAYELVTPASSDGRTFGDLQISTDGNYDAFPTELVSPSHRTLLFATKTSTLPIPDGGGSRNIGDNWVAERTSSGWKIVRLMSPSAEEALILYPGGISSDHRYSLIFAPLRLTPKPAENGTLTREGDGDFLVDSAGSVELTGVGSLGVERLAQGRYVSPGGEHVIFSTGRNDEEESGWCSRFEVIDVKTSCPVKRLEPEAPPSGTGAIYDRPADGPTHVVSLLPGDVPQVAGENAFYQGTSSDGSTVAFKIGGTLYIRADNGASGARTLEVAPGPVTFGGISADGTYLFYVVGGNIHRLNTETDEDKAINLSGDGEMVNVPADGSKVYFVSRSQLDGAKGTGGEPNLYVWRGDTAKYIATVAESDIDVGGKGSGLTSWTSQAVRPSGSLNDGENFGPGRATSRTTSDGNTIVFESRAPLRPSYDNAGHIEIYRYDVDDEGLDCVSCNPSGEPATVDTTLQGSAVPSSIVRNLTEDGKRVFFETREALVDDDIDGVNDVYEWLEGDSGPVLALISSGTSPVFIGPQAADNTFLDPNILMGVSPDGHDVFFRSVDPDPLVPGAPEGGAQAIYDARVDGGAPTASVSSCSDIESCRPQASSQAPMLQKVASMPTGRSGNIKPRRDCKRRGEKHSKRSARRRPCSKHKPRGAR